ncbi:MAG TPA: hypothetical protein VJ483_06080 [Holophagaceae bacterium]|nr:hypothetical protein [Holophagaceae bacterium]
MVAPLMAQVQPGEALAVQDGHGRVSLQGEARREWPMGSLAKLVWLRLGGSEWERRDLRFPCTGTWQGMRCWNREGHGDVDFSKALRDSCNLAFLAWARELVSTWARRDGEAAARARLEAAFRPFLGDRMPAGEGLPLLGTEWVGAGDLLRVTPAAMLAWLAEPTQAPVRTLCRRHLGDVDLKGWWIKTGTGAVEDDADATSAWAAGSDGARVMVLHLPRGRGKAEGLARFKALAERP